MLRKMVLAAFAALLTVLAVGCVPEHTSVPDAAETEAAETEAAETEAAEEGFTISVQTPLIYSVYADDIEKDSANALKAALEEICQASFDESFRTDYSAEYGKDDTVENSEAEILIGATNRKQSKDAAASLDEGEFTVRIADGKLVIAGYDPGCTAFAVSYFIGTYLGNGAESLSLPKDLSYTGSIRSTVSAGAFRYLSWNLGSACGDMGEALFVLEEYPADLMGFQESNKQIHEEVLDAYIERHPSCKYAVKSHEDGTLSRTPILYNSETLTLVESGVEWLRGRYTGTKTKSLSWAVFDGTDGTRFAAINFHGAVCSAKYEGYENYTKAQRDAQELKWRLDNVAQILEKKEALEEKYGVIPVLVSGDCNFMDNSRPYKKLTEAGFLEAEKEAELKLTYGYATSYLYGYHVPGKGKSIDHIFGIGGAKFALFNVIRDKHVEKATDHCSIYADVRF